MHDWLLDNDISPSQLEYSSAKDWITVTLSIRSIERLLDTKYSLFRHEDGSHLVRTLQWSLPKHLHEHVQTIQPTNSFFRPRSQRSTLKIVSVDAGINQFHEALVESPDTGVTAKACNASAVTSLCLRTLYGM